MPENFAFSAFMNRKDISFIENTIYVHQTMQRLQVENAAKQRTKLMLTTPKSPCSIRVIPIPEDIVNLLKNTIHEKQGYMLTCQEDYCIEPRTFFRRQLKPSECPGLLEKLNIFYTFAE